MSIYGGRRRLRIAQVAPLTESVPPERYGGTERVVSYLTEELCRRGHDVVLYASGDSTTQAELIAPIPRALRRTGNAVDSSTAHTQELGLVLRAAESFDVIHFHLGSVAFPVARLLTVPNVHTLHGRLDVPGLAPMFAEFTEVPLISISDVQRTPVRALALNWLGTVHHGIPIGEFPYYAPGGDYLAFVGRISPEKRPDLAIEVARRAGFPLKIAAKVDDVDRTYFEREIRPLLGQPHVEFLGELDEVGKRELLAGAFALLFPVDWPEPFGLVMIEAMATGTPVIARPFGAVPEVLMHGRTGFMAESVDQLVNAVQRVERLERQACRQHVAAHFTVEAMADRYEALYRRVMAVRMAA